MRRLQHFWYRLWRDRHLAAHSAKISIAVLLLAALFDPDIARTASLGNDADQWPHTDFTRTAVPLAEIIPGGPPKDGIPAIDHPRFIPPAQADAWLDPREPVIVLEINRHARAYPLQILIYHEIVNDTLAGIPIAVTFCPLCNAAIVFDRRIPGTTTNPRQPRVLDFGTTGRLRKSDMVMYDRQTESWWQQFIGTAIVGELTDTTLKPLPATIAAYEDFKAAFPGAEVLSRDTGHSRPYGRNPYRGYDTTTDQPFLFTDPVDPRLPAMERVLGVSLPDGQKIYPLKTLPIDQILNDRFRELPLAIFTRAGMLSALDAARITDSRTLPAAKAYDRRIAGKALTFKLLGKTIMDNETGSHWNLFGAAISGPLKGQQLRSIDSGVHFAFAWLAFQPDSVIYQPSAY